MECLHGTEHKQWCQLHTGACEQSSKPCGGHLHPGNGMPVWHSKPARRLPRRYRPAEWQGSDNLHRRYSNDHKYGSTPATGRSSLPGIDKKNILLYYVLEGVLSGESERTIPLQIGPSNPMSRVEEGLG